MTELPSGRGQTHRADLRGSGRRYVLRYRGGLHELTRWQPRQHYRHVGEALLWLRRFARDSVNERTLDALGRELGAGGSAWLAQDRALPRLARQLVQQGWGLIELAQPQNQPVALSQVVEEPEPAPQQWEPEDDDIGGYLVAETEDNEMAAQIQVEPQDGELEATIDVETEDAELEAMIGLPGAPPGVGAAPPEPASPTTD